MRINLPLFHVVEHEAYDSIFRTYGHLDIHSLSEIEVTRVLGIACNSEDHWVQEKAKSCLYEKESDEELIYLRGVHLSIYDD